MPSCKQVGNLFAYGYCRVRYGSGGTKIFALTPIHPLNICDANISKGGRQVHLSVFILTWLLVSPGLGKAAKYCTTVIWPIEYGQSLT